MSTLQAEEQIEARELIDRFREAQRARAAARRATSLLILGAVAVYGTLIWATFLDFRNNRLPQLSQALAREAAARAPGLAGEARGMLNRLHPHYVDSLREVMERDWGKLRYEALAQADELDAYAQDRWPRMQEGIARLAATAENVSREELSRVLPMEQARQLGLAYGEALHRHYDRLLSDVSFDHTVLALEIGENLESLIATEPDIEPRADCREAVGILLELAGVELQESL